MNSTWIIAIPCVLIIGSYLLARRKIEVIHKLVNSQLHSTLDEIELNKKEINDLRNRLDLPPKNE